jgi:hypothetical protein
VTLRDGSTMTLNAGQFVIIPPDGNSFGRGVMNFNIGELVSRLLLIQGFSHPLASMPAINDAIQQQTTNFGNGLGGPIAPFDVVGEGLDLTGGNLPPASNPNLFINYIQQPISPTKGTAP